MDDRLQLFHRMDFLSCRLAHSTSWFSWFCCREREEDRPWYNRYYSQLGQYQRPPSTVNSLYNNTISNIWSEILTVPESRVRLKGLLTPCPPSSGAKLPEKSSALVQLRLRNIRVKLTGNFILSPMMVVDGLTDLS